MVGMCATCGRGRVATRLLQHPREVSRLSDLEPCRSFERFCSLRSSTETHATNRVVITLSIKVSSVFRSVLFNVVFHHRCVNIPLNFSTGNKQWLEFLGCITWQTGRSLDKQTTGESASYVYTLRCGVVKDIVCLVFDSKRNTALISFWCQTIKFKIFDH